MRVRHKLILFILVLCLCQQALCLPAVQTTEPPPPPPPPLPPDYMPPPMTEEWQIQEFDWEEWYWMNLAKDYMDHKLTAEQEQILLNNVHQSIENSYGFENGEYAIIYAMARNLDPQHYFSTQHALGVVMR
jgi:hypothetical protein